MAKTTTAKKEKIVSALSIWRMYDVSGALEAETLCEMTDEETGLSYSVVAYNGHAVEDGSVRIKAYYARPSGAKKYPAILLLKEAHKPMDLELMSYYVQKGYAVLMPDYSGAPEAEELSANDAKADGAVMEEGEGAAPISQAEYTVYPESLSYANYSQAQGFYSLDGIPSEKTCWFEWTYVALYSLEFLKAQDDVTRLGVVGIRTGGELAWKVMLSPDVACGVPVNAAGWLYAKGVNRFGDNSVITLTDERHRYIAAVDSQSYAPFVKCPVLMLCALSDYTFDYDRAYDTYGRIGGEKEDVECAIAYSPDSGSCIGEGGLLDMWLFLEKHLKGREIYIPKPLNITVNEKKGKLAVEVVGDEEAIVEEMGVCYAEADVNRRSIYREWQCVHKETGAAIKDGKLSCEISPFEGTTAAFVYAYAKYLNGFKIVTKVVAKRLSGGATVKTGSRMLFSGEDLDCFSVANHEDYSVAGIFLEREATPKLLTGYGNVQGAYSLGGIKTYKISSPRYVAQSGALLKFDAYSRVTESLRIGIEVAKEDGEVECYFCYVPVKGGGKWKRIILEAKDFKSELSGRALPAFSLGSSLSFGAENEDIEYIVTNILWL